jgi:hypothetical protein
MPTLVGRVAADRLRGIARGDGHGGT